MRVIRLTAIVLALAVVAAVAPPALASAPNGSKWQAAVTPASLASFESSMLAERAMMRAIGMQVSGPFTYGLYPGPGSSDYSLKGAYPSGTVLEARGYYVEQSDGRVYVATRWRTRRGGTSISSNWNTGGSNSNTYSEILSYTTGYFYGHREDYPDYIGVSTILLTSYPDCSVQYGTDRYQGTTANVTADPTTDGVSGLKSHGGAFENNNLLDCGEQAR